MGGRDDTTLAGEDRVVVKAVVDVTSKAMMMVRGSVEASASSEARVWQTEPERHRSVVLKRHHSPMVSSFLGPLKIYSAAGGATYLL